MRESRSYELVSTHDESEERLSHLVRINKLLSPIVSGQPHLILNDNVQ